MEMETLKLDAPIGVIDSGVGGLTVLKCLHKYLPHEEFIYLGDTARTPYGVRPETEIRQFVVEMIDYLAQRQVKLVVIACNTLTMLGTKSIQGEHPFTCVGMSKGEELMLKTTRNKCLGVMATPFTIKSDLHRQALLAMDPSVTVVPVPCPKFVTLVEGEKFGSAELQAAIAEYTEPIKKAGVDTVILSCTHFPFLKKELEQELGAGVVVLDPAEVTAQLAKEALAQQGLLKTTGTGKLELCCTADLERVQRLAAYMLPDEELGFKEVALV